MTIVGRCPGTSSSQCQNPPALSQPDQHGGELMLQAAALLPSLRERFALCPHVSPAVVPRGCWAWVLGVCRLTVCQVMGRDPGTRGTQHGDIPSSRAQAWPVLLWSRGVQPSVVLAALVLMPG